MGPIIACILSNWPTIGIVVLAVFITWKVSSWVFRTNAKLNEIENLPCNEHKNSISNLSVMRGTVDSINEQVTEISKWVMRFDNTMIDPLSQKCSPRVMTAIGKNLFHMSGADKVLKDNAEKLIQQLESLNPQTAYDVESRSVDVLLSNLAEPMFNDLKSFIYYQPDVLAIKNEKGEDKNIPISLMSLVHLMGIELRDMYLSKHTEIK